MMSGQYMTTLVHNAACGYEEKGEGGGGRMRRRRRRRRRKRK